MEDITINRLLCLFGLFIVLYLFWPSFNKDIKCVDGDTFAIGKTYYRLSYIDTPEKGEPGYKKASLYTCNAIKKGKLKFINNGRDKYNRILTEVILDNGDFLNDNLIKECLAEPFYGKTTQNILDTYNSQCK